MKLLIRLDDYTPNRVIERWGLVEALLDRQGVRPLVAVVPDDRYFGPRPTTSDFWDDVRKLAARGWAIGVHGETHEVVPIPADAPREIFFASKSEFVGLSLAAQLEKISSAWNMFERQGINPTVFVAPNHGLDANTVEAIRRHGRMRYIADGIALRAYRSRELTWLPQLDWKIPWLRFGFRTVCLHPSTMGDAELLRFEAALARARDRVIDMESLDASSARTRGAADRFFAAGFAGYFRLREFLYGGTALLRRRGSPARME